MSTADLRGAVRGVARAPLIPALVAALMAIGLGSVLAMAALVDALYLRTLPFPAADRIVSIYEVHPQRGRMAVTPANFFDWWESAGAFSAVSGSQWIETNLQGDGGAYRFTAARVLPRYFDVWGVPAALGRVFDARDFRSEQAAAIVSDRVWRERLQAAPQVIGMTIRLDGAPHTVVGVMPAASSAVGSIDVWVPWHVTQAEREERRYHLIETIGRLREDRTAAQASAELDARYEHLAAEHPATTRDWRAAAVPLRDDLIDTPAGAVTSIVVAVAITFVVSCLNVAALLAAWWPSRVPELATRLALGARRGQLVRQLVAESAVIGTAGTLGAVVLGGALVSLFAAVALPAMRAYDFDPRLDVRVALAGAVVFAAVILLTAVGPAVRLVSRVTRLTSDGRSSPPIDGRMSVAAQVAVALVAAAVSVSLLDNVRGLTQLVRRDGRALQAVEIVLPDSRYRTDESQGEFFTRLLRELGSRPEVAAVGASSYVPPTQALGNLRFEIEGRSMASDAQSASPAAIDGQALGLLGVELLRGRVFGARDAAGSPLVCLLSQALARRYWGDADPIGQRLVIAGLDRPATIVGVVSDVRQPLSSDVRAETILYLPFAQVPWPFMTIIVEPSAGAAPAIAAVRSELARVDAGVAPGEVRPLGEIQAEWVKAPRVHALAVSVFGAVALLVTLAGVYARVVHRVVSRRREWAIRQALGATATGLRKALALDVTRVVAVGALLGMAALPGLSAAMAATAYGAGVLPWPRALLLALGICAAAVVAVYLPTRRVGTTALAEALRQD